MRAKKKKTAEGAEINLGFTRGVKSPRREGKGKEKKSCFARANLLRCLESTLLAVSLYSQYSYFVGASMLALAVLASHLEKKRWLACYRLKPKC